MACSSPNQVLRAGSCVSANCTVSTSVIPGLGVCLSELVQVPAVPNSTNTTTITNTTSSTTPSSFSSAPIPSTSATGPTVLVNGHQVPWWQILLMVLGGILFITLILVLWRKCARRQRAEETVMFASARQIDGTDGWRWRLKQVKNILFGGKKGGYDVYDPPMASYSGDGVSHPPHSIGRNLDMELRSPTIPVDLYLDDALSPYPFPKSTHRPVRRSKRFPSTKRRFGNRSPARGYRSPSPTREYGSDDRYPTRGHGSDDHHPARGYGSDDRYPAKGYGSDDRFPAKGYGSDDRYPAKGYGSNDRYPARGYRSDDRYPTREHRSGVRSPTPTTSHHPPPKLEDRWDDRLDNSLSRYPRRDGKSGASLDFLSSPPRPPRPPSYPSQSEHGRASLAVLR